MPVPKFVAAPTNAVGFKGGVVSAVSTNVVVSAAGGAVGRKGVIPKLEHEKYVASAWMLDGKGRILSGTIELAGGKTFGCVPDLHE